MAELTLAMLQKHWPHANQHVPGLIEGIVKAAPLVFPKYGYNTPMAVAHAMGQFSEECGAGLEMEENMNYSAARLLQVFPSHFSRTSAANAAHNPKRVADIAYGGRMGNKPYPSDDGYNFRGRGLSQVTGRDGYTALANKTGFDLLNHPELIIDPDHALECGVADLILCGCLRFSLADDTINETKHLNGGLNGLADRRMWIAVWKKELL